MLYRTAEDLKDEELRQELEGKSLSVQGNILLRRRGLNVRGLPLGVTPGAIALEKAGCDQFGRSKDLGEPANPDPNVPYLGIKAILLSNTRLEALQPVSGAGGAIPQCVEHEWAPKDLAADAVDNEQTCLEQAIEQQLDL